MELVKFSDCTCVGFDNGFKDDKGNEVKHFLFSDVKSGMVFKAWTSQMLKVGDKKSIAIDYNGDKLRFKVL